MASMILTPRGPQPPGTVAIKVIKQPSHQVPRQDKPKVDGIVELY